MSTNTSRRDLMALLGATAGLAGLSATATAAPAPSAPIHVAGAGPCPDPVVVLWTEICALAEVLDTVNEEHDRLRTELMRRYGEPQSPKISADDLWGHDPLYPRLRWLWEEEGRRSDERADLTGLMMMDTPATSVAGVLIKVQCAISVWPHAGADDWHEKLGLAALQDAETVLAAMPGAALLPPGQVPA